MHQRHSNFPGCTPPFCLRKKRVKNLNFNSFFTSKKTLVATSNETGSPTSRKCVARQGIIIDAKPMADTLIFWSHSSVFALEKYPKNLNFQSFFTSERSFGG